MLVILKDILFNHAIRIMYNMEVHEDFLIIKWEKLPALIDLIIGLITSIDF